MAIIRNRSVTASILAALICAALLSGCVSTASAGDGARNNRRLAVYTSFYAMYQFTKAVAGDRADVTNLVPPGVEPHAWEPSTRDMAALCSADIFVYNGAGMEGFIDNLRQNLNGHVIFVDASAGLPIIDASQPHLWLDPVYAGSQMRAIAGALEAADPDNGPYYEGNLGALTAKLGALDGEYRQAVSGFASRDIVAAHNAYAYLCKRYGLNMIALDENGEEREPSPAFLARTVDYIRQNGIKYVFKDELDSPKAIETVANETGAGILTLYTFEGAPAGQPDMDYFECMERNLTALKTALD